MSVKFIKIVDPETAEQIASLGFQYIKERSMFVFLCTDELASILQQNYSEAQYATTSKLTF